MFVVFVVIDLIISKKLYFTVIKLIIMEFSKIKVQNLFLKSPDSWTI